jgi:hypothetical protein
MKPDPSPNKSGLTHLYLMKTCLQPFHIFFLINVRAEAGLTNRFSLEVGRALFFGLGSGSGFLLWARAFLGLKILLTMLGLIWARALIH